MEICVVAEKCVGCWISNNTRLVEFEQFGWGFRSSGLAINSQHQLWFRARRASFSTEATPLHLLCTARRLKYREHGPLQYLSPVPRSNSQAL